MDSYRNPENKHQMKAKVRVPNVVYFPRVKCGLLPQGHAVTLCKIMQYSW